jgi:YVTN family beta-propeller protein
VASIGVGPGVGGIAFGASSVWVVSALDNSVSRIDPRTNAVVARIRVAETPRDIAVGGGSVWVAGEAD